MHVYKAHIKAHSCVYKCVHFITKQSSVLYNTGMAKVLPIIDVLGYDGQNSSPLSPSDSTPITQEGSHIST